MLNQIIVGGLMSLLLDLYSNASVRKMVDLNLGNSRAKQPALDPSVELSTLIPSVKKNCLHDSNYVDSVVSNLIAPRQCFKFLDAYIDSYFDIYTLGVIDKFQDHYIYVYSMQNLLGVVLNHMCNFDLKNVDKIPDFDLFSVDSLEMRFSQDFHLTSLLGVDENLDSFVEEISKIDNSELGLLKSFMSSVLGNMSSMLKYIGCHVESNSILSFMSIDKSKILFRSYNNEFGDITVNYNGITFKLTPLIVKDRFDYVNQYRSFKYGEVLCF